MSCHSENITPYDLTRITNDLKFEGYQSFRKINHEKQTLQIIFQLTTNLRLMFLIKDENCDIIIVKETNKEQILYRDDETQIVFEDEDGPKDLAGIRIHSPGIIAFDEYIGTEKAIEESRIERDVRRNEDSLIEMNQMAKFHTGLLKINLLGYTRDPCLLQYFERNPLVKKSLD